MEFLSHARIVRLILFINCGKNLKIRLVCVCVCDTKAHERRSGREGEQHDVTDVANLFLKRTSPVNK